MRLALIRHGLTEWNLQRRIQGWTDIPLAEQGRGQVRDWRLPAELAGFARVASPLARARETAEILFGAPVAVEPALTEMGWGECEGWTSAEIDRLGDSIGSGLDLQAPGGESPRQVRARLATWAGALAEDTVAITHAGVIRAMLSLATGWDFMGKPPARLSWDAAHLFQLAPQITVDRLNLPLR